MRRPLALRVLAGSALVALVAACTADGDRVSQVDESEPVGAVREWPGPPSGTDFVGGTATLEVEGLGDGPRSIALGLVAWSDGKISSVQYGPEAADVHGAMRFEDGAGTVAIVYLPGVPGRVGTVRGGVRLHLPDGRIYDAVELDPCTIELTDLSPTTVVGSYTCEDLPGEDEAAGTAVDLAGTFEARTSP